MLYLIYALFSGLVGTAFSVLIRLELSGPGVQYIADNQLYNSIITAHAIIMIFFMVKKYSILTSHFTFFKEVNSDDGNNSLLLSESDKNDGHDLYNGNNNFPNKENDEKSTIMLKYWYTLLMIIEILYLMLLRSKKVFIYERLWTENICM